MEFGLKSANESTWASFTSTLFALPISSDQALVLSDQIRSIDASVHGHPWPLCCFATTMSSSSVNGVAPVAGKCKVPEGLIEIDHLHQQVAHNLREKMTLFVSFQRINICFF